MARKKRTKKAEPVEINPAAIEVVTTAELDAAIGDTKETTAQLDTSISEDRSKDATRPDLETMNMMAEGEKMEVAQQRFESVKKGKIRSKDGLTTADYAELETRVMALADQAARAGKPGGYLLEDGTIVAIGETPEAAKDMAACAWKMLGEIRGKKIITKLPRVETRVVRDTPKKK